MTQLKHQVSEKAVNAFWDLSFSYVPLVSAQGIRVPKFISKRRKLVSDNCPTIELEYSFRKKDDGSIINFKGPNAPIKLYGNDKRYEKVCEVAHVKVIIYIVNIIQIYHNK